ncbi:ATP-binding protein [Streptomyces sp. NBC_00464]|uniref:ATP-binding protein n=1 Tax=unclassified Streptomyces TaxID=2593676 RepID=UPI002DDC85C9|nr:MULTISPECIES: ATP-binding protein [unclassified Streptomyces]WRZ85268.1 ATP-binding protein [Streptomyces sp. NBC_01022]
MEAPVTPHRPCTERLFVQRFSSTPRGARLARRLAVHQLHAWGVPYRTDASDTAALLVAELAANAVTHGRVPGRDFELRLALAMGDPETLGTLRIEVTDTRGECRPPGPGEVVKPPPGSGSGHGLVLVEALADRWAVLERVPPGRPGKTVRVELDLLF